MPKQGIYMIFNSLRTETLLVLASILAVSSVACSNHSANLASKSAEAAVATAIPVASPTLKPKALSGQSSTTTFDSYEQALDISTGAMTISETALSREDWSLVASRWEAAIKLLKTVPVSSAQYSTARKKIAAYESNLADAKERSAPLPTKSCSSDSNPQFFSVLIKERVGGIPIIEVMLNDEQKFEMMFDTGASSTLITRSMAATLRLAPSGWAKASLADGSVAILPIALLKSTEIDGRLKRSLPVAVAPASMPIGLLGQDFYKGYDVMIKENIIEFRRRSPNNLETQEKSSSSKPCLIDTKPDFFSVPIQTRKDGIPVVNVTFHDKQQFAMMVDTGSTGTVITRSMAAKLGLSPLGMTRMKIADGSVVPLELTVVKSTKISDRIKRDMMVVVAPRAMNMGLLGQDFFEGYNVTIKKNVVEFRRQRFSN
jgi:predicted aspartyl protease